MSLHLVLLVDVVKHDVKVGVDLFDRLVWSVHGEALEVELGHRAPVGHPTAQKNIINKEIRQLKWKKNSMINPEVFVFSKKLQYFATSLHCIVDRKITIQNATQGRAFYIGRFTPSLYSKTTYISCMNKLHVATEAF